MVIMRSAGADQQRGVLIAVVVSCPPTLPTSWVLLVELYTHSLLEQCMEACRLAVFHLQRASFGGSLTQSCLPRRGILVLAVLR